MFLKEKEESLVCLVVCRLQKGKKKSGSVREFKLRYSKTDGSFKTPDVECRIKRNGLRMRIESEDLPFVVFDNRTEERRRIETEEKRREEG